MNLILFDDPIVRRALLPFTFTRPVAEIRVGILTIREKWEKWLGTTASFRTEEYLRAKYPEQRGGDEVIINGAICPDEKLVAAIRALAPGNFLVQERTLIAMRQPPEQMTDGNMIHYEHPFPFIDRTWKIFKENGAQLRADFPLITAGRTSAPVSDKHTIVYAPENIFIEEGVYIRAAILNAETGPIYLGKNSIVQEGAIIRGGFAMGEGSHVNMGAKMRGDTSLGPFCKVGGEVSNSVLFGYSNKAHDGYLGNSVLGEWCNLGADTNTSNLKNNYEPPTLWNHVVQDFEDTGIQFCGLMMGDHSKSSINTMFNTATVVDVCSNIFGADFPSKYVPSFAWGGGQQYQEYRLDKALETAERVMARRNVMLTLMDKDILSHIFGLSAPFRR